MNHKLWIHIGMPKTGTTTIQQFLKDNDAILRNLGWKTVLNTKAVRLNPLFWSNTDIPKEHSYIDTIALHRVIDEIAHDLQTHHVIYSYEGIYLSNVKIFFQEVQNRFPEVEVLVYLRRQDRWLESFWNQFVKRRIYTQSVMSFGKGILPWLDIRKKLDDISTIIGKEHIHVRVFEQEQMVGQDLISDFCDAIQLPIKNNLFKQGENQNSGLSVNQLAVKRAINACFSELSESYLSLRKILPYQGAGLASSTIKYSSGFLSEIERREILQRYAEDTQYIAKTYLHRPDGILFYDKKPIHCDIVDIEGIFQESISVWKCIKKEIQEKLEHLQILMHSIDQAEELQILYEKIQQQWSEYSQQLEQQMQMKPIQVESCLELVSDYTKSYIQIIKQIQYIQKQYILYKCTHKKLILMPAGKNTKNILAMNKDILHPFCLLDNDVQKCGMQIYGISTYQPSQISDWDNCFVILTAGNSGCLSEIKQQLSEYGLQEYIHYTSEMKWVLSAIGEYNHD